MLYLNIPRVALAGGLLWGMGVFLYTWLLILFYGATGEKKLIGKVYLGYTITPLGSAIGFLWAFMDGLLGGAFIAWLYNTIGGLFFAR
jgi:type III secretory pathway component EscT